MKIIQLDTCAFGLEPDGEADRIETVDLARLSDSGISETALNIIRKYLQFASSVAAEPLSDSVDPTDNWTA